MTMAATLMAAVGLFSSCSKDDKGVDERSGQQGNTYAMVSIALNGQGGMRADQDSTDYNKAGKWEGIDEIKDFTIYLVDKTSDGSGKVHKYTKSIGDFASKREGNATVYVPKQAIKTQSGKKYLYVVVNEEQSPEVTKYLGSGAVTDGVLTDVNEGEFRKR